MTALRAASSTSPSSSSSSSSPAGESSWRWLGDLTQYLDPTHFWGAVGLGFMFVGLGIVLS